jgi:hypothetical protein
MRKRGADFGLSSALAELTATLTRTGRDVLLEQASEPLAPQRERRLAICASGFR